MLTQAPEGLLSEKKSCNAYLWRACKQEPKSKTQKCPIFDLKKIYFKSRQVNIELPSQIGSIILQAQNSAFTSGLCQVLQRKQLANYAMSYMAKRDERTVSYPCDQLTPWSMNLMAPSQYVKLQIILLVIKLRSPLKIPLQYLTL